MVTMLREAAKDVRYLVDRGYPNDSAIRFVADHYRLPEEKRFILARVIVPAKVAKARQKKMVSFEEIKGKDIVVDGYNVLITVESLLGEIPVYKCDDGFLRDTRGIFRKYKASEPTVPALSDILGLLAESGAASVKIVLDQQISMSGELAATIRRMMDDCSIDGTAKTTKDADYLLKKADGIVATGDGNIIDAANFVVDIPGEIARRQAIQTITL